MNIYIGCSGFSYKHWKERFYPSKIPQRQWFEYYCTKFNTVELNSTFYRLPNEKTVLSWYNRSPENFAFSVKASRFITHIKRLKDCKVELENFFEVISPLDKKLKVILWQLPPSFKVNIEVFNNFLNMLTKYNNIKYVFEFRHKSWLTEDIYSLCNKFNICICIADYPEFLKNPPITANFLYVRRHGKGGRYNTLYTRQELEDLSKFIKDNKDSISEAYIYFNNDFNAYAPQNAQELIEIINK